MVSIYQHYALTFGALQLVNYFILKHFGLHPTKTLSPYHVDMMTNKQELPNYTII